MTDDQIPMPLSGSVLRDRGIARAEDHAETEAPGWKDSALDMLRRYVREVGGRFQAEDVREFGRIQCLDEPPNSRAWGGVIVKAKKLGIIQFAGYENVSNPRAHATPASLWESA